MPGAIAYRELTARDDEAGCRLDVLLARRFGCSRTAIHQRMCGPVLGAAGRPRKWSHRVRPGEVVRIPTLVRPEPDVEVRYQLLLVDDWLVAVDKGPGAPVHPVRSYRTRNVLSRLRAELGDPGLSPAHRLDRETSGVLLFGRGGRATSGLGRQFAAGGVSKTYLAVVRGEPAFDRRCVDLPLGPDPDFPIRGRVRVDERQGQASRTELRVIRRLGDRALVEARRRTGRMHQIRVHLAALGHPLLGDKLYQDQGRAHLAMIRDQLDPSWLGRLGHHRLALHAAALQLAHPATGEPLCVQAPLPADLDALLSPAPAG